MRFGPSVALILLLLTTCAPAASPQGPAVLSSSVTMRGDVAHLGGLSGLAVSHGGTRFVALSDRGYMFTGQLDRRDGRLTGARAETVDILRDPDGAPVTRHNFDAEGLDLLPDGRIVVSFEQLPRVWVYPAPGGTPQALTRRGDFPPLPLNGGLESVATDGQGRIHTLPEDYLTEDGRIPVWRLDGRTWVQITTLPASGDGFLPSDADFGPDGKLYVLERAFKHLSFQTRIRRFDLSAPGDHAPETLLVSIPGQHDNLEGMSVWRDDQGAIRITLVADDNYLWVQRSEVAEYVLPLAQKGKTP